MGKPTGFLEYNLVDRSYRPVEERVQHYKEFVEAPAGDRAEPGKVPGAWIAASHTAIRVAR